MKPPEKRTAAPGTNGRGSNRGNETVSNYHIDKGKQAPSRRDLLGDSELDRPRTVTFWDDIAGTSKREKTQSLRELADLVEDTVRPSKEDLHMIKVARFGSKRSAKRSLRHDDNLDSFEAVEGDYDAGEMPIQEARDLLKKAGLAALLFETPSSTRKAPRWRVILPCSKAMHPEDREALVARANGVLGGILAGESFSSSQFYYAGTVKGKQPEILLVDGRPIDKARELDKGAISKRKKDREAKADAEPRENNETDSAAAYRKAMQLHLNGGSFEDFEEWAIDNPWTDYQVNPDRALERTWENAKGEAGRIALEKLHDDADFEDISEGKDGKRNSEITVTMASEITPENINWFWKGRLAEGKGTMLTGLPGMGKSQLSLNIAATISKGGRWPDGTRAPKGTVLILASEDAANDTMVPRIIAAGGNREKIGFIQQTVGRKGKRRILTLKEDLERLAQAIRKFGDAKLVIIDPITGYMGNGVDSHKATDVRAVLSGVSEWAQDLGIAVLAITHPAKSVTSAMNAMVGSQAYVAFFRMNFIAGEHPDDADLHEDKRRRVFSKVKGNNGKHVESFSYTIESVTVEGDIESSRIVWGEEVAVRADDLVSSEPKKSKKSDEAKEFLKSQWDFDPDEQVAVTKLQSLARDKGIAWRTIERAKEKLPIMPKKIDGK